MAVNTTTMLRDGATENTDRGPTPAIWGDCPIAEILEDPGIGMFFFEDFLNVPNGAAGAQALYGNYWMFADTGGSVTEATQAAGAQLAGVKVLSSDGDNEGASFQTVPKPFEIDRSNNGKKVWFEARIKTSTIADTKHNILVGFMDNQTLSATVPITALGAIADINFVGFRRTEAASGGAVMDVAYKANGVTAVTLSAGGIALVADTWVKLGMTFTPTKGQPGAWYLQFYKNGAEVIAARYQVVSAQGTDFPNDVGLGVFMAVLNATGTTPGTSSIDWIGAAQLLA